MIGCGLARKTAHMTDGEFWHFVFRSGETPDLWEPDLDDYPEMIAAWCMRCSGPIRVESYEEASERQDESFCDDCASEHADYEDEAV